MSLKCAEEGFEVRNAASIIEHMTSKENKVLMHINPLCYDVSDEAEEKIYFHWNKYTEDILVQFFYPISGLYIWWRYGYNKLQIMGFAPPDPSSKGEDDVDDHKFVDPNNPGYHFIANDAWFAQKLQTFVKLWWVFSFFFGGSYSYSHLIEQERCLSAYYMGWTSVFFYLLFVVTLSNKKAFRKESSETRMMLHRERRHEELFFGWLPLPKELAVMELRVAAHNINVDLHRKYFTFRCSERELRKALGYNIVSYLERDENQRQLPGPITSSCPIQFNFRQKRCEEIEKNIQKKVDGRGDFAGTCNISTATTGDIRCNRIGGAGVGEEKEKVPEPDLNWDGTVQGEQDLGGSDDKGSKCTAFSLMLRMTLDKSFASPAFGGEAKTQYLPSHVNMTWLYFVFFLIVLPFIVAHLQGGGSYTIWDIVSLVFSTSTILFYIAAPPQGFTYGALLSILRRTQLQNNMNSLLMPDHPEVDSKHSKVRNNWLYSDAGWPQNDRARVARMRRTTDIYGYFYSYAVIIVYCSPLSLTYALTLTQLLLLIAKTSHHTQVPWAHEMDLTRATNLESWRLCSHVLLNFGDNYRKRTDANGAILILYVGIMTLFLVLGSVTLGGQILFSTYCYAIILHSILLCSMGAFALTMSMYGDECNNVGDLSKNILASAMLNLEAEVQESQYEDRDEDVESGGSVKDPSQAYVLQSSRYAATQLQEVLSSTKVLYAMEMFDMVHLDRNLGLSIVFAMATQITLMFEVISFQ